MYPQDNDDGLAGFEAGLKALRPRAPSHGFADRAAVEASLRSIDPAAIAEGFADRVVTESRLREPVPASPTEGFADRVVAACVSTQAARWYVIRFPGAWGPFAAAAALALAFAPALLREKEGAPEASRIRGADSDRRRDASATFTSTGVAEMAAEFPAEALHLPVINLPDGRAYRPVLRREATPSGFRAMPGGVVMPVLFTPSVGIDYEAVVFE